MCPLRYGLFFLSIVIGIFQIQIVGGQLRNVTLYEQGIDDLDYFEPKFNNGNITRIVGGKQVKIRQVPWQIALYKNGYFICGGSIISVNWVLTAAHCVEGGGSFAIRAGSSYMNKYGQIRWARLAVIHAKYKSRTANRDIAMLRVGTNFEITKFVRPIKLARLGRRLPERFFVSGWGTIRQNGPAPAHLRGVTVHRLRRRRCRAKYSGDRIPITKYMICAFSRNKDSCQGDSGGPLVRGRIQYGIVSFGIGCAHPKYPGVYTNIRALNRWIKKVVKRWGGKQPKFV